MDGERLITAAEAWAHMGISERSFYRWVRQVGVRSFKIGRSVRYKWSDIERALNARHAGEPDSNVPPEDRDAMNA